MKSIITPFVVLKLQTNFIAIFLFTIGLLFNWSNTFAQTSASLEKSPESFPKNTLYFEGYGNAFTASVNYEREIAASMTFRVGIGAVTAVSSSPTGTIALAGALVPLMANYFIGQTHALELGLGAVMFTGGISGYNFNTNKRLAWGGVQFFPTSTIGYRFRSQESGFMFKFGVTPYWIGEDIASGFVGSRNIEGFFGNPIISSSGLGFSVGGSIGWSF